MNDQDDDLSSGSTSIALIAEAEINQQIATAKKWPRSIAKFRKHVQEMVTLSDAIAAECIYALPRDGKVIRGPSARFAEIIASAWGNNRAGARVVSDEGEFVTAQGVFHDLETNSAITYEVQRRITNKRGERFGPDMIGVTANAACSIALRNAVFKGVPKAYWSEMYNGAQEMAMGTVETLPNKRAAVMKDLLAYGITPDKVYAKLGIGGMADIGLDHLLTLRGVVTAIKDGDMTPESFDEPAAAKAAPVVPRKSDQPAGSGVVKHQDPLSPPERHPDDSAVKASGPTLGDAAEAISKVSGEPAVEVLKAAAVAAGADPLGLELATPGERQMLAKKLRGHDVIALLEEHSVTSPSDPATLEGITKADYRKLKGILDAQA